MAAPLVVAFVAVCVVLIVAWFGPTGPGHEPDDERADLLVHLRSPLSPWQVVGRVVGVSLLAVAIVLGRFGPQHQLTNLAPALVMGLAWPLLIVASAARGHVWNWLNPWDAIARALDPLARPTPPEARGDVRWAVPAALAWSWYLHVYRYALEPDSVAVALTVYTVAIVAGCVLLGRVRWLSGAEIFTVFLGWVARIRYGALVTWRAPRGAELLLGALAGGLLFGPLRQSRLYGGLNVHPWAGLIATAALLGLAATAAGLLHLGERVARRASAPGTAAAAAVPAVAALALAVALSHHRLTTSAQLVVGLASDPLGRGWDLFGTSDLGFVPAPLTTAELVALQLLILLVGHAWGARVIRRRVEVEWGRAVRDGPVAALCVTLTAAVLTVSAVPS